MVTLTSQAENKIADLLASEDGGDSMFLRVEVRPGGCSGFSYNMFFDSEKDESDVENVFGSVKVVSDSISAGMLNNAELDYKDGLTSAGFSITNPNAQRTCGCGQSFS